MDLFEMMCLRGLCGIVKRMRNSLIGGMCGCEVGVVKIWACGNNGKGLSVCWENVEVKGKEEDRR